MSAIPPLPPGQRPIDDFPRFGLPAYASRWPTVPADPTIEITGEVTRPSTIHLSELANLERSTQVSDFHCVTTWTRQGLSWTGWSFRDVFEHLIAPRVQPNGDAGWIGFRGLDGYRTSLMIEDALRPEVLLADDLDGEPLPLEHGAPIRVVAPTHYGYKSVKHLCRIEFSSEFQSSLGWKEHPRARAGLEERARRLPAWVTRRLYRAVVPAGRAIFRRAERHRPEDPPTEDSSA